MYGDHPFGNPDGARADINEIFNMFIENTSHSVDFTINPDALLSKRVIVGAKGSGKTIYLRKMQAILKSREENDLTGIYVDNDVEQDLNCTERIIGICDFYNGKILSEKWTQLWKLSIYISLANKFLNDALLNQYVTQDQQERIIQLLEKHNLRFRFCISVYKTFPVLLNCVNTKFECDNLLGEVSWLELEDLLAKILRKSPVIYLFLDAIDIEYEHAPTHWTICQKGLFNVVMGLLQQKDWGERLHIIIAMRNNVFASVLRSEHGSKYSQEAHILYLNWSIENIRHFIKSKIEKLNECYFLRSDLIRTEGKNIQTWLGIQNLTNPKRMIEEDVITYIIRHTRLVPRDVIIICNQLAKAKRMSENRNDFNMAQFLIDTVSEQSNLFGDELITICAKNVKANMLPSGAGRYEYSDAFTATNPYKEGSFIKLKRILERLPSDRVTYDNLATIETEVDAAFQAKCYISDILWQNGALGFIDDKGYARYYTHHNTVDTSLPQKSSYIIRSCIAGCLDLSNVSQFPEKIR